MKTTPQDCAHDDDVARVEMEEQEVAHNGLEREAFASTQTKERSQSSVDVHIPDEPAAWELELLLPVALAMLGEVGAFADFEENRSEEP